MGDDRSLEELVPLVTEAQARAFENAKAAVEADRGEDLENGEVVAVLARAYTGHGGE